MNVCGLKAPQYGLSSLWCKLSRYHKYSICVCVCLCVRFCVAAEVNVFLSGYLRTLQNFGELPAARLTAAFIGKLYYKVKAISVECKLTI